MELNFDRLQQQVMTFADSNTWEKNVWNPADR